MARPKKQISEEIVTVEDANENASLREAIEKSKNQKARHELTYPPKYRNFRGKDFSENDMADIFESKVIQHGDFTNANLDDADFSGFNLQGCIFRGASMKNTDFSNCDLRWSNFTGADPKGDKAYFGTGATAAELTEVDGLTR